MSLEHAKVSPPKTSAHELYETPTSMPLIHSGAQRQPQRLHHINAIQPSSGFDYEFELNNQVKIAWQLRGLLCP